MKTYAQVCGFWKNTPETKTINTICLNTWDGKPDDDIMFYMDGEMLCAGEELPIHPEPYVIEAILNVSTRL